MDVPRAEALFDSVTLAAVAAEIGALGRAAFAGVRQPTPDSIVVTLAAGRTTRHLLASVHAHAARVHFARRPDATERLSPFGTLLRSRLPEARLAEIEQPAFNRVLRLGFDALEGRLWLIAEVMGRHSNLILADARVVLGALKVVTPRMSPRRPMLPGRPYIPPPAGRPTPETLELGELAALLRDGASLDHRLSHGLLGVSPILAREIAIRASLDPAMPAGQAAPSAEQLLTSIRAITAIVRDRAFSPLLYLDGSRAVAFACFPMRAYEEWTSEPMPSISAAIERYSGEAGPGSVVDHLAERRTALAGTVRSALSKREAALTASRRTLAESGAADRHRLMGDLILTHASEVGARDAVLRVPDYSAGGADISIPLDPDRTAVENAQEYFRRYAKARATARAVPQRIARLEAEVGVLRDALVQIDSAASLDDLLETESDLAAAGLAGRPPRRRPAARTGPRQFRTADGGLVMVGRSARENDRVTFREAGPDDLWFHARGLAGAHVVLKTGSPPSDASVRAAAGAAAYYSEARRSPQVAVDAVARKHVRKPPGAPPGTVTYSGERTLLVTPALPAEAARPGGRPGRRP